MNRLLFLLLLISIPAFSQDVPPPEIDLDTYIQEIAAVQQNDINYEDLYESLLQFYLNPLNINSASIEELRSLNLLSELQLTALTEHRKRFGDLVSLYELQSIAYFDTESIQRILPFVRVSTALKKEDFAGVFKRATDHFLVLRMEQTLQQSEGFKEGKFLGSAQKYYGRYRLQHPKDFSLGVIVEKDAGEENLADYVTAHFQLQNKGVLKNMVLGDYQLQFGQGLISSGGYAAGKGGEPIYTTRRSHLGIRPHNSVLEGGFYRGGAATWVYKGIEWTFFGSRNGRDASPNTLEETEETPVFSSLLISGLHRTESEIARKNVLTETAFGGNLHYNIPGGHVGFSALQNVFSSPISRIPRSYTQHEFRGQQNLVFGPNFSWSYENFNLFGEAARSSSGGIGAVGGFVASLSKEVEWAVNVRSYDKDFHSFYANAFGEGSRTINERGIYTGLKYRPSREFSVHLFYDRFRFPWARYLVDAPSSGHDYLVRINWQPEKTKLFYVQYHREQKERNAPNNETVSDFLIPTYRSNLLANADVYFGSNLRSQTRLQRNTFRFGEGTTSTGYAFIQDIEWEKQRMQVKTRLAYFSTDTYDSRIYAYENDVLYAVSFPAYFGRGIRTYGILKYDLNQHMDVWIRISHTQRTDGELIGSGINKLPGSARTDVKVQVRYAF